MKKFIRDLKMAISVVDTPREWTLRKPPIGAMAKLILIHSHHQNDEPIPEEIRRIDFHPLEFELALMTLSCLHGWWDYSEHKAQIACSHIISVLGAYGYKVLTLEIDDIVSKRVLLDVKEANFIIQRLCCRDQNNDERTLLELGLIEALARWSDYKAYGLLKPGHLRAIRKTALNYTQEAMAREIGMTLRQYVKYEAGTTPIPDEKVDAIRCLVDKKRPQEPPTKPPKSSSTNPFAPYEFWFTTAPLTKKK